MREREREGQTNEQMERFTVSQKGYMKINVKKSVKKALLHNYSLC